MKMIVHDLKSPRTSVIGAMEMLVDGDFGPLTDNQRRALVDTESRAQDLLSLIEDLLELAKLEESRLPLHLETPRPAALLQEVSREWELRVHGDAKSVDADQALIKRVFSNLIQNALTHSAREVTVTLGARAEGDGTL